MGGFAPWPGCTPGMLLRSSLEREGWPATHYIRLVCSSSIRCGRYELPKFSYSMTI